MEFDFTPSVDNIELVPTDFRPLYEEKDGKHNLRGDDFSKAAISAITGLNRALKASRVEVKVLKDGRIDLAPLKEYGATPSEIAEAFNTRLSEATKGGHQKSKEEIDRQVSKIKEDLAKGHMAEMDTKDRRVKALTDQLYSHLVIAEAKTALAEAGAIDSELALPFIQRQVKVTEEDGKFNVQVVDSAGDTRYSGTTAAPLSVKELVAEMKANTKYAPLFKSESPSGGGARPEDRRAARKVDTDGEKAPIDKIRAGIEARQQRRR